MFLWRVSPQSLERYFEDLREGLLTLFEVFLNDVKKNSVSPFLTLEVIYKNFARAETHSEPSHISKIGLFSQKPPS